MPFADNALSQPFFSTPPLPENRVLPVAIVSGYFDTLVEQAIRRASDADADQRLVEKPVALTDLTDFLERARHAVDRRGGPTP
jgi:hypothetical protein